MSKELTIIIFILVSFSILWSNIEIDLESGAVFTGYNDVRIPGDNGTLFSLKDDLKTNSDPYFRSRLIYHLNPKHHIILLYAPLTVKATGKVDKNLDFQGEVFQANTALKSIYKFNSYRISYRYDFVRKTKVIFGLGFTAKIRDALISLANDDVKAEKKNVGFVPIINFELDWKMNGKLWLILEGDALAAPQGRAEDIALNLEYHPNKRIGFKIGYRLLEGGADNDEVYTFSLFHYAFLGLSYQF